MTDLISRADAIKAVASITMSIHLSDVICDKLLALPSADANPTVVRCKTMIPYGDFREWAKRIREDNPNVIVIPFDAEVISADAVQGEWIDIDNYYRLATCSHCNKVTMFEKWGERIQPYNYCPNCGAKMKWGDSE